MTLNRGTKNEANEKFYKPVSNKKTRCFYNKVIKTSRLTSRQFAEYKHNQHPAIEENGWIDTYRPLLF